MVDFVYQGGVRVEARGSLLHRFLWSIGKGYFVHDINVVVFPSFPFVSRFHVFCVFCSCVLTRLSRFLFRARSTRWVLGPLFRQGEKVLMGQDFAALYAGNDGARWDSCSWDWARVIPIFLILGVLSFFFRSISGRESVRHVCVLHLYLRWWSNDRAYNLANGRTYQRHSR